MPTEIDTRTRSPEAPHDQAGTDSASARGVLVSIIVSSFNYARYLKACIDSALGQTYPYTEVIVVDDGSTDASPAIIDAYGTRIRAIHKPNGGQASAMNRGFAASRGEAVIFLDADDVLLPHTAERVVAALRGQPGLAKVEYPLAIIDGAGHTTGQIIPPAHVPRKSGDMRRYELTAPFDMVWMAPSGTVYARHVLERIMPVPAAYNASGGPDWYLAHVSALHGPVLFLGEVGGHYRVHGANTFAGTDLDLRRVAWAIDVMRQTGVAIRAAAHELGLQPSGSHRGELLSFSYVAHRMILTRLGAHEVCRRPEPVPYLVWLGLVALARRQDISTLLKGMMAVWLLAMAAAPRPWAHWLARSLLLSENRPRFVNQLLRIGHGWHARARRVVRSSRISKEVAAIAILADRG